MVLVWRITDNSPNLPNFLPAKLSCYTVCVVNEVVTTATFYKVRLQVALTNEITIATGDHHTTETKYS